ncbi:unknown [Plasmavirus L2]|jgi:hypothetical protein|uniref:Uncharacterized 7.3 kDa protein n=1 Tax=Acholeplasma phage L2 TaxID=46014 RepID=YO08_BPL2|nr:hypothetical protein L2_09 [Plasmavirus L2]P42543.2 RecName: Full=Uncharacterized 7.3 kDa protein; AltName: Full=ORF8 [Plasmavirus L2]AAA87964.1 unknown [Plasmavirus L2]
MMKKYMIERDNKFFSSFGNDFDKKGRQKLKPIYSLKQNAVYFSSLSDAQITASRVQGKVIEIKG